MILKSEEDGSHDAVLAAPGGQGRVVGPQRRIWLLLLLSYLQVFVVCCHVAVEFVKLSLHLDDLR